MLEIQYKVLTKLEDIIEFRDELYNVSEFVFDLETTGINVHAEDFEIIGAGFSFRSGHGVYIAFNSEDNEFDSVTGLKFFEDVLTNPNIGKIGQNLKYDLRACYVKGVDIKGVTFDTQIANYCIWSDTRAHNIDDMSLQYFNIEKIKTKSLLPKKSSKNPNPNLGQLDPYQVGIYCCEDVDTTFRAYELLKVLLEINPHAYSLFYDMELPVYLLTYDMEKHGAYIDQDRLQELSEDFTNKITEAFDRVIEALGRDIDINKTDDLRAALYDELKIQNTVDFDIPTTDKTKKLKTDAPTLKLLKSNAVVNDILIVKKYNKFLSTFIEAYPKDHISKRTGCIHASFMTWITATGRFSCLTGDSEILLEEGTYCRLDELVTYKTEASSSVVTHTLSNQKIINYLEQGIQEVFEVELEDGKKVKATLDHKFLTDRGWVQLKYLTEQDCVYVIQSTS